MLPTITLCLTLAGVPGVVDEDVSCVPIYRVSDRVLGELSPAGIPVKGLPALWEWAVEDEMNHRSDDGLRPETKE